MADVPGHITQLFQEARQGDADAANHLYDAVYEELRRIAHQRLSKNRPGRTLNTTALVHEVYLRMVDPVLAGANDRAHFFALASRAMRFVLVDYARRRTAGKRGGGLQRVPLKEVQVSDEERTLDLIDLNDALEQLTAFSDRLGRVVEYRFFGGLSYEEIAEISERSVPTVKRDWQRARVWLYQAMRTSEP